MKTTAKSFSFLSVREQISNFIYSNYYLVFVALIVLFFWTAGWIYAGFSALIIIGCYIFLTQRDMTPIIPLLLSVLFLVKDPSVFSSIWIYLTFIPVLGCLIAHFIMYPIKKIKLGKLFFPLLAVFIAYLLGGIGSSEIAFYSLGFVRIFGIGLTMLVIYFVLSQYICPDKHRDFKGYIFNTLLFICIIPCVQLLEVVYVYNRLPGDVAAYGWGNSSAVGSLILIACPSCFYLMVKEKKIIPYFLALAFFIFTIITANHDSGIGILVIMLPVLAIFTYRYVSPEKKFLYTIFLYVGAIGTVLGIFFYLSSKGDLLTVFTQRFLNDTGRTDLYLEAIKRFLIYPIFGNGAYYPELYPVLGFKDITVYHSVIFHPLATMGIVGFLAYGYLIFGRYRILMQKNTLFNFYAFYSATLFQIYAFIDCVEFLMVIVFLNVLVMLTEKVNETNYDLPHIRPKWLPKQNDYI